MKTIQRSIVFTKPQKAFIDQERKRLGISTSEVVRRIIDEYRERKEAQQKET